MPGRAAGVLSSRAHRCALRHVGHSRRASGAFGCLSNDAPEALLQPATKLERSV
jgi:hypothetical protein